MLQWKEKCSGISVLKAGCWRINLEPFVIDVFVLPKCSKPITSRQVLQEEPLRAKP